MTALLPDLAHLPKFESMEEERLHRKQRLAASFRLFGKFGFDEGVAGHITVRDPEHADRFWVNPFGMNFKHMPELPWRVGYPLALTAMVAVGLGLYAVLRRARWL